jgi:peptidyl-prolyl cis-trans isomerase A (cyclophilin A)
MKLWKRVLPFLAVATMVMMGCSTGDAGEGAKTVADDAKKAKDELSLSADGAKDKVAAAAEEIVTGPAALLDPNGAAVTQRAPEAYKVKFETTAGDFVIQVTRNWAPKGADRFYNLVNNEFFTDVRFFRVIKGFMAQFGISGDPKVSAVWRNARLQDDPVRKQNKKGFISFATSGPNSRTTQVFINYRDNSKSLDPQGFSPFGEVIEGIEVVDALHGDYGEGAPRGKGPDQGQVQARGNAYLAADFPNLDHIIKATIVE